MPDISPGKDAYLRMENETSWAAARDSATAETVNNNVASGAGAVRTSNASSAYDCHRSFFAFDTSGITVAPTSATLKIHGHLYATDIIVVKVTADATGDSSTDWAAGDFRKIDGYAAGSSGTGNITKYCPQFTGFDASDYNEIELNAAALADMASLDEFKLCVMEHDDDFKNVSPSGTSRAGFKFVSNSDADVRPLISYVASVDTGGPLGSTLQGPLTGPTMDVEFRRRRG